MQNKIKIVADENVEFVAQNTKDSKRKELYSTSIEVKNARFSDDSIKEANVDIASYVVYNDENDFINQYKNPFYLCCWSSIVLLYISFKRKSTYKTLSFSGIFCYVSVHG